MKPAILLIFSLAISTFANSQLYTNSVFLNIWKDYRSSISSANLSCDIQHYRGMDITRKYHPMIYTVEKNGDTTYKYVECTSDQKIIPTYHDKNTSKLFKETYSIPLDTIYNDSKLPVNHIFSLPIDARRYLDSLAFVKVFNFLISSPEYGSILSSNYNFYLSLSKVVSPDQLNMEYTVQVFEILDDTHELSSEYGAVYVKGNFEKLKPYIVDEFTKKLRYPN